MRYRLLSYIVSIMLSAMTMSSYAQSSGSEKQETEAAIRTMCQTMVERYPAATLQDLYKTCYQDFFGAEHMITDTAAVRQYLHSELAELPKEDGLPISEPTGYRHRFQRMNLRAVQEGTMTEEDLLRAFLEAGHTEPVGISWQDEWSRIERIALDVHPAWKNKSLQRDLNKAAQQKAAVRHSNAFRKAYKPHYRIIRK